MSRKTLIDLSPESGKSISTLRRLFKNFLNQKSKSFSGRSWYTHKSLRRTRALIKNALPDMFYFLDDFQIPKSTNGLESTFSYLKNNFKIHKGLTKLNRKNFIRWYNYFKYPLLN